MADMHEQEFNAKQRLEEGVSLLDLVEKCPKVDGEYRIDEIKNHNVYLYDTGTSWTDVRPKRRVSQVCKRISAIVEERTGVNPEIRGSGLSQSHALAVNALPAMAREIQERPEVAEIFRSLSLKIQPVARTTSHDAGMTRNGGSAVSDQDDVTAETVATDLRNYSNVIVEGVAGCGKSHLLEDLAEVYEGRVEVVVFHPSTSYEDFVSGLRPQLDGSFKGEAGVFVDMCERACNDPERDYLLFVDEINRANTSRVFGDLMLVLEASKRVDLTEEAEPERTALLAESSEGAIALQTPVSLDGEPARKYLRVPRNLHILGTMNTTDRSVGTIDLALRRRFHWITMEPLSGEQLASELETEGAGVDSLRPLIDWYSETNRRLKEAVGPDARLGHSYFFGEGKSAADIATGLLNQLKEVVATFNIKTADVDSIIGDGAPVGDEHWRIHLVGQGLGRRPEIEKVSAARSSETDGRGTSQGSGPEETSTAAQG